MSIDLSKIYSSADHQMASQIANDAETYYKLHPCGIKYKAVNVHLGIMLMFAKQYESKLSSKLWTTISNNQEANIVWTSINDCNPKTCHKGFSSFVNFEQFYFRYLFRMCHAKYLASTGEYKDFAIYLDDNERIRRIIRPKHGVKIAPLFKLNTEVFKECKKLLS